MKKENDQYEKSGRLSLSNRILLQLMAGLIIVFIIAYFLIKKGFFREGDYEAVTNAVIFYLLFSIALIIYRELRFRMVVSGMLLMAFQYFFDTVEELVFFREDGIVDRLEDLSQDYIILTSVVIMFLGFVVVLKKKERKIISLKHKSLHDPLTGIFNRGALFQIYGDTEINEPVTFCYLDLDGFKEINDRNGHEAGDTVLRDFAEIITRHKRGTDQFFRIGGDEFILVADTLELETVGSMIERFKNIVKEEISEYSLDFTCGVVPVSEPLTLEYVLRKADSLMYEKKKRKKG